MKAKASAKNELNEFRFFKSFHLNVFNPTCFEKTAISSLNDSELQTSPPATPGSLGVQVASSHFSKIRANKGNKGCLKQVKKSKMRQIFRKIRNVSFQTIFEDLRKEMV